MRRNATMPLLGETVTEGTISAWLVAPGEAVLVDEPLFEVSTDKVDSEVPATFSGTLVEILAQVGDTVPVGAPVAVVETEGDADGDAGPSTASAPVTAASPAPAVHQVAVPQGVESTRVVPNATGSGDPSRRTAAAARVEDRRLVPIPLRPVAQATPAPAAVATIVAPAPAPAPVTQVANPAPAAPGVPEVVPAGAEFVRHTTMRRVIGRRMSASLSTAAHTLAVAEADYEKVHAARALAKATKGPDAAGLTYLAFVCRAVIAALRHYPAVNSHVYPDGLLTFAPVHLGLAVDLDMEGLIVPVVANADDLGVLALSRRIADIADRARAHRLAPEETDGGTITVTNSGSRGSVLGRPVINLPQAVIVEMDMIQDRVVAHRAADGSISMQVRRRGFISLSYDHRAFDGAYACSFLKHVCDEISNRDWSADL